MIRELREHYEKTLGLSEGWTVENDERDDDCRELTITVIYIAEDGTYHCPVCRRKAVLNNINERTVRHLDFCEYKTWLFVKYPRIKCPVCGIKPIVPPFAAANSRYTIGFETRIIELCISSSIQKVAKDMRLDWHASGTNFGDIAAGVGDIVGDLQKTSDGADIIHLIKRDVYKALANKASTNKDLIKVAEDHIMVGTAKFYLCNSRYWSYKAKAYKDAIPDKTELTLARDDAFSLFYCALDSFDADFAGMPFFVREHWTEDPEGVKFIGQSRPMPVPNIAAIRKSQVLA